MHPAPEIVPRVMRLVFDRRTPRYWAGGDPTLTHLFNSLSLAFPRGEKMFIESVRAYHEHIEEPALRAAVRDFTAQEINHSRTHAAFNQWLSELGLPVARLDAEIAARIAQNQRAPRKVRLAITCALEHFTALLAGGLLRAPDLLDRMDDEVAIMWLWHAIEELEHKSVAFDVYRHVDGPYSTRALLMVLVTFTFITLASHRQRRLLRADGKLSTLAQLRTLAYLLGPGGQLRGIWPQYFAYYRPDFHPLDFDDRELLTQARARLERALAERSRAMAA